MAQPTALSGRLARLRGGPSSSSDTPAWAVREGWLGIAFAGLFGKTKRKQRFFVLDGDALTYFKKLGDVKVKGSISLAGADVTCPPAEGGSQWPLLILVRSGGSSGGTPGTSDGALAAHRLEASSKAERDAWVEALSHNAKLASGGGAGAPGGSTTPAPASRTEAQVPGLNAPSPVAAAALLASAAARVTGGDASASSSQTPSLRPSRASVRWSITRGASFTDASAGAPPGSILARLPSASRGFTPSLIRPPPSGGGVRVSLSPRLGGAGLSLALGGAAASDPLRLARVLLASPNQGSGSGAAADDPFKRLEDALLGPPPPPAQVDDSHPHAPYLAALDKLIRAEEASLRRQYVKQVLSSLKSTMGGGGAAGGTTSAPAAGSAAPRTPSMGAVAAHSPLAPLMALIDAEPATASEAPAAATSPVAGSERAFPFTASGLPDLAFDLPPALRVFTGTWNMAESLPPPTTPGLPPAYASFPAGWLPRGCDVYALSFQECMEADAAVGRVREHLGPHYLEVTHRIGSTRRAFGYHGYVVVAVWVHEWLVASGICRISRAVRSSVALGRDLGFTRATNKGAVGIALPLRLPDANGLLTISSSLVFIGCHLHHDVKGATRLAERNEHARELLTAFGLNLSQRAVARATQHALSMGAKLGGAALPGNAGGSAVTTLVTPPLSRSATGPRRLKRVRSDSQSDSLTGGDSTGQGTPLLGPASPGLRAGAPPSPASGSGSGALPPALVLSAPHAGSFDGVNDDGGDEAVSSTADAEDLLHVEASSASETEASDAENALDEVASVHTDVEPEGEEENTPGPEVPPASPALASLPPASTPAPDTPRSRGGSGVGKRLAGLFSRSGSVDSDAAAAAKSRAGTLASLSEADGGGEDGEEAGGDGDLLGGLVGIGDAAGNGRGSRAGSLAGEGSGGAVGGRPATLLAYLGEGSAVRGTSSDAGAAAALAGSTKDWQRSRGSDRLRSASVLLPAVAEGGEEDDGRGGGSRGRTASTPDAATAAAAAAAKGRQASGRQGGPLGAAPDGSYVWVLGDLNYRLDLSFPQAMSALVHAAHYERQPPQEWAASLQAQVAGEEGRLLGGSSSDVPTSTGQRFGGVAPAPLRPTARGGATPSLGGANRAAALGWVENTGGLTKPPGAAAEATRLATPALPWSLLTDFDQLRRVIAGGQAWPGFSEPPLAFPPTYRVRKTTPLSNIRSAGHFTRLSRMTRHYSAKKEAVAPEVPDPIAAGFEKETSPEAAAAQAHAAAAGAASLLAALQRLPDMPAEAPETAGEAAALDAADPRDASQTEHDGHVLAWTKAGGGASPFINPKDVRTPSYTDRCIVRTPLLAGIPVEVSAFEAELAKKRAARSSSGKGSAPAATSAGAPQSGRTFIPFPPLRCLSYTSYEWVTGSDHYPVGGAWELPLLLNTPAGPGVGAALLALDPLPNTATLEPLSFLSDNSSSNDAVAGNASSVATATWRAHATDTAFPVTLPSGLQAAAAQSAVGVTLGIGAHLRSATASAPLPPRSLDPCALPIPTMAFLPAAGRRVAPASLADPEAPLALPPPPAFVAGASAPPVDEAPKATQQSSSSKATPAAAPTKAAAVSEAGYSSSSSSEDDEEAGSSVVPSPDRDKNGKAAFGDAFDDWSDPSGDEGEEAVEPQPSASATAPAPPPQMPRDSRRGIAPIPEEEEEDDEDEDGDEDDEEGIDDEAPGALLGGDASETVTAQLQAMLASAGIGGGSGASSRRLRASSTRSLIDIDFDADVCASTASSRPVSLALRQGLLAEATVAEALDAVPAEAASGAVTATVEAAPATTEAQSATAAVVASEAVPAGGTSTPPARRLSGAGAEPPSPGGGAAAACPATPPRRLTPAAQTGAVVGGLVPASPLTPQASFRRRGLAKAKSSRLLVLGPLTNVGPLPAGLMQFVAVQAPADPVPRPLPLGLASEAELGDDTETGRGTAFAPRRPGTSVAANVPERALSQLCRAIARAQARGLARNLLVDNWSSGGGGGGSAPGTSVPLPPAARAAEEPSSLAALWGVLIPQELVPPPHLLGLSGLKPRLAVDGPSGEVAAAPAAVTAAAASSAPPVAPVAPSPSSVVKHLGKGASGRGAALAAAPPPPLPSPPPPAPLAQQSSKASTSARTLGARGSSRDLALSPAAEAGLLSPSGGSALLRPGARMRAGTAPALFSPALVSMAGASSGTVYEEGDNGGSFGALAPRAVVGPRVNPRIQDLAESIVGGSGSRRSSGVDGAVVANVHGALHPAAGAAASPATSNPN